MHARELRPFYYLRPDTRRPRFLISRTCGIRLRKARNLLRCHVDFFFGTFSPARRASDKPMAIACFRLLIVLPELPLFKVPALRSCIVLATFFEAALEYLRAITASFDCKPVSAKVLSVRPTA